jgi:hypothetical protein
MTQDTVLAGSETIVATIENEKDPTQSISIQYLREENAFVTSGIKVHFDEREILIPAYLVIMDLRRMGAIISAILEKLSQAHDRDGTFEYVPQFDALDKTYTLVQYGAYMKLSEALD